MATQAFLSTHGRTWKKIAFVLDICSIKQYAKPSSGYKTETRPGHLKLTNESLEDPNQVGMNLEKILAILFFPAETIGQKPRLVSCPRFQVDPKKEKRKRFEDSNCFMRQRESKNKLLTISLDFMSLKRFCIKEK